VLLALQGLLLVGGAFSKIARVLSEERKAGLLDANRLTPLYPTELVHGYWLGAPLREIYMTLILVPTGFLVCLWGELPLTTWLQTQVLVLSSALMFGLLAFLPGMAGQKPQGGIAFLLLAVCVASWSWVAKELSLTNFVLPIYAISHLLAFSQYEIGEWGRSAKVFATALPPIAYTLIVQLTFSVFLWRAAVRKLTNPSDTAFTKNAALILYSIVVFLQHGLIWKEWGGEFLTGANMGYGTRSALPLVHCAFSTLGLAILAPFCLNPEAIRVASIRSRGLSIWDVIHQGGFSTAVVLASVATAGLVTQTFGSFRLDPWCTILASANFFLLFASFALWIEICRLYFRTRAKGVVILGLFIMYALPGILSAVMKNEDLFYLSLFVPGAMALVWEKTLDYSMIQIGTLVHFVLVVGLAAIWIHLWRNWLRRSVLFLRLPPKTGISALPSS